MTNKVDVTRSSKLAKHSRKHVEFSWSLLKEALSLEPSRKLSIQFVRSIVVSTIALAFDFGLLIVLIQVFDLYYLLAAALSYSVGVVVNYELSVRWVFADHKLASKKAEFTIFATVNTIGLGLNLAIIAGLVELFSTDYRWAKVVSTVAVFFWNFILGKKILY